MRRSLRVVILGLAFLDVGRSACRASESAKRLNGALINVKQPAKAKAKVNVKVRKSSGSVYRSTKPVRSQHVKVFRNKSNI